MFMAHVRHVINKNTCILKIECKTIMVKQVHYFIKEILKQKKNIPQSNIHSDVGSLNTN